MKLRRIYFITVMLFLFATSHRPHFGETVDLSGDLQFATDRNDEGVDGKWYDISMN